MELGRRALMRDLMVAGSLTSVLPLAGRLAGDLLAQSPGQPESGEFDQKAADFWNHFADSLPGGNAKQEKGAPGVGDVREASVADLGRAPEFFHYSSHKGFRDAVDIPPEELLPTGDVAVSLNVEAFRPSEGDRSTFERLQSAQLRIDVTQEKSLVDLLDRSAWTALAALFPGKNGKLPPLADMSFDPVTTWEKMQNILLPGGSGHWALNLFIQNKASRLDKILGTITNEAGRFAPILGLPAISVSALRAFTGFYGYFQPSTEFVFNSVPTRVLATATALKSTGGSRGLPLVPGNYVMVPRDQIRAFAAAMSDHELRQGYVVPKGTPATKVYETALAAVPDVTYVTVNVGLRTFAVAPAG